MHYFIINLKNNTQGAQTNTRHRSRTRLLNHHFLSYVQPCAGGLKLMIGLVN